MPITPKPIKHFVLRTVYGWVYDGVNPVKNANVKFILNKEEVGFTIDTVMTQRAIFSPTDDDGYFEQPLWCDETSEIPIDWRAYYPNQNDQTEPPKEAKPKDFSLTYDDGEPISIGLAMKLGVGVPPDTFTQILQGVYAYILTLISSGVIASGKLMRAFNFSNSAYPSLQLQRQIFGGFQTAQSNDDQGDLPGGEQFGLVIVPTVGDDEAKAENSVDTVGWNSSGGGSSYSIFYEFSFQDVSRFTGLKIYRAQKGGREGNKYFYLETVPANTTQYTDDGSIVGIERNESFKTDAGGDFTAYNTFENTTESVISAAFLGYKKATDAQDDVNRLVDSVLTNENGIALLSSTVVQGNAAVYTKQDLYTVPVGKKVVITGIIGRTDTDDFSVAENPATFGYNASADDTGFGLDIPSLSAGRYISVSIPPYGAIAGNANEVFGINLADTSINAELTVEVFGYLIDSPTYGDGDSGGGGGLQPPDNGGDDA